jgi:DnaJ like chaperone protein
MRAMHIHESTSAYTILEIDRSAKDHDVKIAYRKMAAKFHPDKVSHLGDDFGKLAEEKFKAVNDAYEIIKKERNIK